MTLARGAILSRALVRFGHRRPWLVISLAALVVAAGVGFGSRLHFETDVLSLVPRHDPVVDLFKRTLEEFGSLETLVVAVEVPSDEHLDLSLALVEDLAAELEASPHLSQVQARLEDPARLAEAVLQHAVLFLDDDGLAQLEARLSQQGLDARAADIRAALDTPLGMLTKDFLVRDPLGFLPLLLGRVARTPATLRVDYASGYYLSADHTLAIILARPNGPAQNISFDEILFADLEQRVATSRARLAEAEELPLDEVPGVLLGGGHRIALEDATLIKSDIILNSVTSLLGVMALFYLAYRRFAAAQYAFLPLAVGLALTFIFTALALGRLNSATSGFSALLVGLGIDFTIVMYGRYLEERHRGASLAEALDEMAGHSGPAVLLGAVTTVGTFYAFLLTRFAGLRELGLLTGTGIVLMALSTFLLLPALITVAERGTPPRPVAGWLHVVPLIDWCRRRRTPVLVGVGLVTVVMAGALTRVRFDDDVRNLRSPANRGVVIQQQVAEAFGLSFNAMMVRIEAPDLAGALGRVQRLTAGLDRLVDAGVISSYESLANLFPPQESQERARAWLAAHPELTDPGRVRRELASALTANGMVAEPFAGGLALLDEALRPGPVGPEVWRGTPVERVVERSLRQSDGRVATVVNVFAPPGQWRRQAPPQLDALVASVDGASLTGVNVVSERLRRVVWRDAAIAGGVGLAVVLLMLLWELASLRGALLVLLPVVVGVTWTVGIMAFAGLSLNLLNVFVITMVIGVGVDYGIHMVHRLREGYRADTVGETARAVIFAAMTTIVGFGSLATTHYPGLQSIGWMASLGVLFSSATAVLLLPLLVRPRGR